MSLNRLPLDPLSGSPSLSAPPTAPSLTRPLPGTPMAPPTPSRRGCRRGQRQGNRLPYRHSRSGVLVVVVAVAGGLFVWFRGPG